jgi:hypothetical protein
VDVPQGWQVYGGTARTSATQLRFWTSIVSPGDVIRISLNDPSEPFYVQPAPLLSSLGFGVGSRYAPGGASFVIQPYMTGSQFAVSWGRRRFGEVCSTVKVTSATERPDLSREINALTRGWGYSFDTGEATFSCQRNGMETTGYVSATTLLNQMAGGGGPTGWQASDIDTFLAPTPMAGQAASMLAHMVKSFRLNPTWVSQQQGLTIEVANTAAKANAEISDSIMSSWQQRNATMDRVMEKGADARRGYDNYVDPMTGAQYKVDTSNSYKYYWIDSSGTKVLGSNTDDPPPGAGRKIDLLPPK